MSLSLKKENDIKLLSFDIDNTLIDFHTLKSNFTKVWKKHKPQNRCSYSHTILAD